MSDSRPAVWDSRPAVWDSRVFPRVPRVRPRVGRRPLGGAGWSGPGRKSWTTARRRSAASTCGLWPEPWADRRAIATAGQGSSGSWSAIPCSRRAPNHADRTQLVILPRW